MSTFDTFALGAEIAATILGFSGIAVVLGTKAIRQFGPRLILMVSTTTAALCFSLIPMPLLSNAQSTGMPKTLCEAALAVFLVGLTIFLAREFVRGLRDRSVANPYLVTPFFIANLIVAVAVSRETIYGNQAWTNYIWGLVFLLITAAYLFARMIWMTWREMYSGAN